MPPLRQKIEFFYRQLIGTRRHWVMETLPNETLLHIFNFAIGDDDVETFVVISETCRLFNEVSKLHSIYSVIDYIINDQGRYLLMRKLMCRKELRYKLLYAKSLVRSNFSNIDHLMSYRSTVTVDERRVIIDIPGNNYWPDMRILITNQYEYAVLTAAMNQYRGDKITIGLCERTTPRDLHELTELIQMRCYRHYNVGDDISNLSTAINRTLKYIYKLDKIKHPRN